MPRRLVVHPTRFVVDDDTASIQAVFGELAEDEHRTEQICTDVAAAAKAGRTCLVLTQRTSHIDAISERLAEAGHSAHILKGDSARRPLLPSTRR